ncbi:copper chaperone CopZ [Vagococcus intermedius]|uniref:Copper chaperone CopZ n=1 Tax=Vagococcus intermedius TaxID=2991418 RepID=A0AAF0CTF2_9ENTE|nr:copper chaperone CopZ [Vagococcus intermedius]WEG72603.1 copper chaperone CopZ [Vagococcus intermedius]WEG74688.1 copper chaperone CopZ [Vagococcus intermedius]
MKKELLITGMSCQHCVASIEKTVGELAGVTKIKINLKKGKAKVKFDDSQQSLTAITSAIEGLGFQTEVI